MKIFQYCVFRFQDTMKKRRKRIISFILALFILSIFFDKSGLAVNAQEIYETEQPQLQLYAMSAVLIDATNDRILYQKEAFKADGIDNQDHDGNLSS